MKNETNALPQWPGWNVIRLIGQGSYGAVYEIEREVLGDVEKAALKVISIPQNKGDLDEYYMEGYSEADVTAAFRSHLKSIVSEYSMMRKLNGCANIVHSDDIRYIQHDDGIGWEIYIKMELLTPLSKALPANVPEQTVIQIAKDMCAALELCRKHGIIHRDIKPQNIFLSPHGDYKLGDFGIAKTVEKTMGGTKIGTYKFMAPEVYNNQPYGTSADINSLGLVLYWLLNERRAPFVQLPPAVPTASEEEQARARRFRGEPMPPPAHGSEKLKKIVLKACAFDPADRYRTAAELLADLNSLEGVVVDTEPVPAPLDDGTVIDWDEPTRAGQHIPMDQPVVRGTVREETVMEKTAVQKTGLPAQPQEQKPAAEDNPRKKPVILGIAAAAVALVIIIILLLRGCGGTEPLGTEPLGTGDSTGTAEIPEETWLPELNTDRLALFQDGTAVLTVSGVPEDAKIKWKSDDKSVAKVSSDGEITAVGEGTTIITATWKHEGETYEMTAEVTVTASGVTLNEYTISDFYIGQTRTLTATTSPEGEKVEWKSSDEKVVTVSDEGIVTAVGSGSAAITVSFGTYSETCDITVTEPGVTLSKTTSNLFIGDSTTVTVKTDPEGAEVTWSSDDSSVATVSGGEIRAVGAGTTTIHAKISLEGKTYEEVCTVKVIAPSVSLSDSSLSMAIGKTWTLRASTNTDSSVSWSSSNTGVATVSGGKVTAVAPGSATITAQISYEGKTYKASCSVEVATPSISLDSSSLNLIPGESKTLSASTNTDTGVSWSSSNTSVATVSGGKVTAVAPGSATITAQITVAGKSYKASCSIAVGKLDGITIAALPGKTSYYTGETLDTTGLTLTAAYSNGINKTVTSGFTCSQITVTPNGAPAAQTITVTYQGCTATFQVTVDEQTVQVTDRSVTTNFNGEGQISGTYSGDWKYGKPNGYGTMQISTGVGGSYTGNWVNGAFEGQGNLQMNNGSYIIGSWSGGYANGYVKMNRTDTGLFYEGDAVMGKLHGHGTATWSNGDTYTGEFANDTMNGYGVGTWANGDVYEGQWANGKRHGQGKMTYVDGRVEEGQWQNDKFVG